MQYIIIISQAVVLLTVENSEDFSLKDFYIENFKRLLF